MMIYLKLKTPTCVWKHALKRGRKMKVFSVISAISNQTGQVQNAAIISSREDVAQIYEFFQNGPPSPQQSVMARSPVSLKTSDCQAIK